MLHLLALMYNIMGYQATLAVSLTGTDIDKFDLLLEKYPNLSKSAILRTLIRAEYANIKKMETQNT